MSDIALKNGVIDIGGKKVKLQTWFRYVDSVYKIENCSQLSSVREMDDERSKIHDEILLEAGADRQDKVFLQCLTSALDKEMEGY